MCHAFAITQFILRLVVVPRILGDCEPSQAIYFHSHVFFSDVSFDQKRTLFSTNFGSSLSTVVKLECAERSQRHSYT